MFSSSPFRACAQENSPAHSQSRTRRPWKGEVSFDWLMIGKIAYLSLVSHIVSFISAGLQPIYTRFIVEEIFSPLFDLHLVLQVNLTLDGGINAVILKQAALYIMV